MNALHIIIGIAVLIAIPVLIAVFLRRVVQPNEVHIVQSGKKTISYGKDYTDGNSYYEWPTWMPIIGVITTKLPVSVFDINLVGYEAYDIGRVPFAVDIKAFFRITDSNTASQRVSSFAELNEQLNGILQGATRTILAVSEIEEIMEKRGKFGQMFTDEVDEQLKAWGVTTVKNIELMDVRDTKGDVVIKNIMEKKKSMIEMQSRTEVAKNKKLAETAEIEAVREVELRKQEAHQVIGERTAQQEMGVGMAKEKSQQAIKDEQKITVEKDMAVKQVANVKQAEIQKEVQVVAASQDKETTVLRAQGQLESKKLESEGVQVEGAARATAEKLMQLAPVEAQIVLAKEIGENANYQTYLIRIEEIKKNQVVGVEQAKALSDADLKVIVNSGEVVNGINNVMDLFTSKGGTSLAGMAEAFSQTETGAAVLNKLGVTKTNGAGTQP